MAATLLVPPGQAAKLGIEFEGRTQEEIGYHVGLLHEAGLIDALCAADTGGIDGSPRRLTWAGHEFLAASREPGRREKAKRSVLEKTGGPGFEALEPALFQFQRDALT